MLKIILILVVMASSFSVGNWFSKRLTVRRKYISAIISSMKKTKSLMYFNFSEILMVVADSFGCDELLSQYIEISEDSDFQMVWKSFLDSVSGAGILNEDDIKLLSDFGRELGVSDINGQVLNCDLYISLFEQQLEKAKESEQANGRLYRVLGFSLGCAVGLIVI